MSYCVVVEPEARSDLTAAVEWYEEQLHGLGREFLISAEASFSFLERSPEVYHTIYRDVRRSPIKRFPFGLFYVIRQTTVHVIAVYHARRDPTGWKERLYRMGGGTE